MKSNNSPKNNSNPYVNFISNNNSNKKINNQNQQASRPKLYTFYDYIKKKNDKSNNIINTSDNIHSSQSFQDIRILNTPEYKSQAEKGDSNIPDFYSEQKYITMPISSGFGGYTNTTIRKPQSKPKSMNIERKPVKLQPLYRVDSDDEDLRSSNSRRHVIVEDEPEEVVHVVHRSRAQKPQKEKIVYIEDDQQQSSIQSEPNIIIVDRSISPQKVFASKPSTQPQVIYTQGQLKPTQKYIIQQKSQPSQVIYSTSPVRKMLAPAAPQFLYINDPSLNQPNNQNQIQYIVQNDQTVQTIPIQYVVQSAEVENQTQYIIQSNEPQYVIQTDLQSLPGSNYIYAIPPNISK